MDYTDKYFPSHRMNDFHLFSKFNSFINDKYNSIYAKYKGISQALQRI